MDSTEAHLRTVEIVCPALLSGATSWTGHQLDLFCIKITLPYVTRLVSFLTE